MPAPPNDDFSARIRRTLEDLAVIRKTLLSGTAAADGSSASPSLSLDLELASELKSVVDAIRLLLWAYIQALSSRSGRPPDEVLNWYKMELAVEMLRSVRARMQGTPASANETRFSFDELVTEAISVTSSHIIKKPSTTI